MSEADEDALRRELMGEGEAAPAETPAPRRRRAAAAAVASEPEAQAEDALSGAEGDDVFDLPEETTEEVRLHPVLTNAEFLAAQESGRKKFEDERKKAALKAVSDQALADLRYESNLRTGDGVKDEMVDVTIDLAEHSDNIKLDGRQYWHGRTYPVPRHVADTLRDIMARGWNHQDEVDGKNLADRHRANRQIATISKHAPGGKTISGSTGAVH